MANKSARFVPTIRLKEYDVINKEGKDMGQVQTFIVDMNEGLIAFVLVAFGGTLGFGDKWFALPWESLKWQPEKENFLLGMSENILKDAPGMDKNKWMEVIEQWQEENDLELLDRYYTSHGYESYKGVIQRRVTNLGDRKPDAKFEVNMDVAGEYRFKLVALNGQTIAVSQGYNAKESALQGIESVRQNAPIAVIDDVTIPGSEN
ncbi:protein of unknown function DUF1508 [Dehalogenimonas lykanthroporepellens BL-DC-9]|jgi:uncharacterized protein YegP (UPF0339 family)/sporulation protein YlmC with PRC-barrel domain|nr:protein of unknown function DUF1508 [Dehalogenimonas lykanthroporepellens BL-DC-9]